jgi:hypothetical protein
MMENKAKMLIPLVRIYASARPSRHIDASSADWTWKYRFTGEIYLSINEITLQAKPPSYEAILEVNL